MLNNKLGYKNKYEMFYRLISNTNWNKLKVNIVVAIDHGILFMKSRLKSWQYRKPIYFDIPRCQEPLMGSCRCCLNTTKMERSYVRATRLLVLIPLIAFFFRNVVVGLKIPRIKELRLLR